MADDGIAPGKTFIGAPLTPAMLKDLQALDELPPPPADFHPEGEWVNAYRIWVSQGYREDENLDIGFLKIQRAATAADGRFSLVADLQVFHREAALNTVHAEAVCRHDPIASLLRWRCSSRFVSPEGNDLPDLATEEICEVAGDEIRATVDGRTSTRPGSAQLTADWCLYEAVQRLPFMKAAPVAFDMLEGFALLRPGHRLSYGGSEYGTSVDAAKLHRFHQLGHGSFPWEYWLDEQHRLVLAVTHNRAYVLDDKAEEKFGTVLKTQRLEYIKKKKSEMKDLDEREALRRAYQLKQSQGKGGEG